MLEVKRDDFDESPEDILKTINNMLNGKTTEKIKKIINKNKKQKRNKAENKE